MMQDLLAAVMGGSLTVVLLGFPLMLVVRATRPAADDRDAFIRLLPPFSQSMTVREAHLRMLLRQEMLKHAKIEAVLAVSLVALGLSMAAIIRLPVGLSIASTVSFAVTLTNEPVEKGVFADQGSTAAAVRCSSILGGPESAFAPASTHLRETKKGATMAELVAGGRHSSRKWSAAPTVSLQQVLQILACGYQESFRVDAPQAP